MRRDPRKLLPVDRPGELARLRAFLYDAEREVSEAKTRIMFAETALKMASHHLTEYLRTFTPEGEPR